MATANLTAVVSTRGATKATKELNSLSKSAKVVDVNVKKAGKSTRSFGKDAATSLALIQGPLSGVTSRFVSLNALISSGNIGFTALAAGITLTTIALASGVSELDKLNLGLAKSEALIKATGGASGFTAGQLQEQAQALAMVTLASTEGIQKAQGILQTFDKVNADIFTRAIGLAQDLAAVYGGDASSQATQLGKALQSPIAGITALNRVGVTFSDTQKEQIRLFVEGGEVAKAQEIILSNLASQVGGAGAAGGEGTLTFAFDSAGQSYTELVASLADSSGAYKSTISLVNLLNDGLRVSAQLADKNSDRNFQALVSQRQALKEEVEAIKAGTQDSLFSFLGGSSGVELIAAQAALDDITVKMKKIQDLNVSNDKAETKAAEDGKRRQKEIRDADLITSDKLAEKKAAKEKSISDARLNRQKAAAQRELETILNLNNSEFEAIQTLEDKRITAAAASFAQQLISFQDFQAAKAEIELNAQTSRQALLDAETAKNKARLDAEIATATAGITSVSDSLIDAASSGAHMGDAVRGAVIGIAKEVIKSGADILIQKYVTDRLTSAAFVASKSAEVTATVAQAGLNAFAATAAIPVVGPALAPAAAAAATGIASGLGAPVIAAASAREQGGSLSAGQSSTVAERGQLEILTPSSSSRIRTKQQMQQLMGSDGGGSNSIVNIVNIDQSSGGVSIETSVDDDGRIVQIVRDTVALDIANSNSNISKSLEASTMTERRR